MVMFPGFYKYGPPAAGYYGAALYTGHAHLPPVTAKSQFNSCGRQSLGGMFMSTGTGPRISPRAHDRGVTIQHGLPVGPVQSPAFNRRRGGLPTRAPGNRPGRDRLPRGARFSRSAHPGGAVRPIQYIYLEKYTFPLYIIYIMININIYLYENTSNNHQFKALFFIDTRVFYVIYLVILSS